VPVNREEILRTAEKLLKQGKMAAAIEEYVRLVEDKPDDWNLANTLGDLYAKAGQPDRAAEQFNRAADHLYGEGFFPRASAVYKKVLKVRSHDDHALWQLADIAARNGLSLDARTHYNRLIQDRRAAGNEVGAIDCVIRLGQLADSNEEAKRLAAQALIERGERKSAARVILAIADIYTKEGRGPEALVTLRDAAQLDPEDTEIQEKLSAVSFIEEDAAPVSEPIVETAEPIADSPTIAEPDAIAALPPDVASEPPPLQPLDSSADALPLEAFFEELRSKVARDGEARAPEELERGKS
jgi:tetratricopeptide (TPR) repeat protein